MQAITDKMLLKLPDFMASPNPKKTEHPHPLKVSRSYPRTEPVSPSNPSRGHGASTVQNGVKPEGITTDSSKEQKETKKSKMQPDAFEKSPEGEDYHATGDEVTGKLPADFDRLPIELISLTDRCVY
jgi:hypothetical protein